MPVEVTFARLASVFSGGDRALTRMIRLVSVDEADRQIP
jgi:hypothetical protein